MRARWWVGGVRRPRLSSLLSFACAGTFQPEDVLFPLSRGLDLLQQAVEALGRDAKVLLGGLPEVALQVLGEEPVGAGDSGWDGSVPRPLFAGRETARARQRRTRGRGAEGTYSKSSRRRRWPRPPEAAATSATAFFGATGTPTTGTPTAARPACIRRSCAPSVASGVPARARTRRAAVSRRVAAPGRRAAAGRERRILVVCGFPAPPPSQENQGGPVRAPDDVVPERRERPQEPDDVGNDDDADEREAERGRREVPRATREIARSTKSSRVK